MGWGTLSIKKSCEDILCLVFLSIIKKTKVMKFLSAPCNFITMPDFLPASNKLKLNFLGPIKFIVLTSVRDTPFVHSHTLCVSQANVLSFRQMGCNTLLRHNCCFAEISVPITWIALNGPGRNKERNELGWLSSVVYSIEGLVPFCFVNLTHVIHVRATLKYLYCILQTK